MNFDDFFNSFPTESINLNRNLSDIYHTQLLSNEALFQLPLISVIILLLAKDKRKPLVSEIGQLVGESIESSMTGFKGSAQHIGWSANLRIRTVKALSFLELTNLISVDKATNKVLITELGKKVISKAINNDDTLSFNLSRIANSYRNICVAKQLDLELE
ncbi:hypothetical protein SAMN05421840_106163 [Shewanella morhuae]|uniref:hypothetical protein n=1 Tax=Shewanella morhuae TaxID=365591 RepID=UPI0009548112|nr:hypothetical protein [Shewanella morhuae]SIQ96161.1 hypothetical protein SAMN05421840_106163 [Shewanella morhuae]